MSNEWKIRDDKDREAITDADYARVYGNSPGMFTMKIHHGGAFTEWPDRRYVNGKVSYVDYVDIDLFSVLELDEIMLELGYKRGQIMYYHYLTLNGDLDSGLTRLSSDSDIHGMHTYVALQRPYVVDFYIEHGFTNLSTEYLSPKRGKVVIEELGDDFQVEDMVVNDNVRRGSSSRLMLDCQQNDNSGQVNEPVVVENEMSYGNVDLNDITFDDVHIVTNEGESMGIGDEGNEAVDKGKGIRDDESEGSGDDESEDSDFIVDDENEIHEVEVDMREFHMNTDPHVEYMGSSNPVAQQTPTVNVDVDDAIGVIDNDEFTSGSDSGDGIETVRANCLKRLRKKNRMDDNATFCVGQTFGTSKEVKELIKNHSVETRRCIKLVKNDKVRIRAVCVGSIPIFDNSGAFEEGGPGEDGGPVQRGKGSKGKGSTGKGSKGKGSTAQGSKGKGSKRFTPTPTQDFIACPWQLHVAKINNTETWMVKTFTPTHKCIQSRKIPQCTAGFLAKQLHSQLESNPEIPPSAIQDQLSKKLEVGISWMKAFRAKQHAVKMLQGDHHKQYSMLRDYLAELQRTNLNTSVRLDVQTPQDPNSNTRQFKRIYVCLGACKEGFKACKREILGLDGSFMKGPFPGWVLTAVGVDPNNGIFPLAYGIVEAETIHSWTWFLTALGEDLDMCPQSNFTFISDRQKGIIPAISRLFPCSEHRYCVKHIHENMKSQWRGKAFKDCLWKAAISTTVPEFHNAMDELKRLNQACFEWLSQIPPSHWTRSHFTGRAKSDILLNNLCEVFNRRLLKARESPIIGCLDFIREYMMKRNTLVQKEIDKCDGPLTPTATRLLENVKKDAAKYTVIYDGGVKYQVSGPWGDQCVVNVQEMVCSCRRWELTGIPCKHVVAANWNMGLNGIAVGIVETWVDQCYWLSTWRQVYSHKIGGINGPSMWPRSEIPTTISPPIHHTPVGRPKKKRRRTYDEEKLVTGGANNARKLKTLTCGLCGNLGHNSRSCKGQGGTSQSQAQSQTTQASQPQNQAQNAPPSQSQPPVSHTAPSQAQPSSQQSHTLPQSPNRLTKKAIQAQTCPGGVPTRKTKTKKTVKK